MPRVTLVKKARKDHGICRNCHSAISKGDSYFHYKFRDRPRFVHCRSCRPKQSQLTQSDKLSRMYAASEELAERIDDARTDLEMIPDLQIENLSNALDQIKSNIESAIGDAADEAREVAEEYEESADNVDEYFPGSSTVDEIMEKSEACETFADELENIELNFDTISNAESSIDELELANEVQL